MKAFKFKYYKDKLVASFQYKGAFNNRVEIVLRDVNGWLSTITISSDEYEALPIVNMSEDDEETTGGSHATN